VGLLSPWFLAGLAAVGLPLWLHLLRQFKRNPHFFSSLMFFERRVQSSVRHRRLRYLILLALRIGLLVLLALAFANPFVNRISAMAGRRKLTLITIDRSFSMRAGDRMLAAKAAAHAVVDGLHGQDLAQIAAMDSHLETQTGYESDKNLLNAAIDSITASDHASSYGEFARALRVIDQGSTGLRLDVHFISDMQQTSMPSDFRDLQLGPHTALQLHTGGASKIPNWAVENVTVAAQVYDPKQTRLTATVAGWQTPAVSRRIDLVLNSKVIASKQVSVPANGRAQAEFLGFDVPYGASRGEVRMESQDGLPADDSYPFSILRADPRPVLFLYAGGRSREAFYYKSALESSTSTGLVVQSAPAEQAANLDLSKYAYLVLSDVTDLDLNAYLTKGGAALILLGPDSARLGKVTLTGDSVSSDRTTQGAGYVDEQSAALAGAGKFQNVQFFQSLRLMPKPAARIIAKLADGAPLLVEERLGEGRVLIFAGMLDNTTTDFPLHASFLPFVVQSGHYLAGAEEKQSSVVAGSPVVLRRSRDQTTAADVVSPDGKHALSLSDASNALGFQLDNDGFYEVQSADGRRSLFAVHADRRESDLTTLPPETLVLWRNTGNAAAAGDGATLQRQTVPYSLWRYLLILVLIGALVESLFASRYLKQGRQTA
jgi:Aerotolerance regulator N-terminal/von Willebrand factor type A domain